MIDDIKTMFSEKPVVCAIMVGAGLVVGVVLAVFTPLGKMFKRKRY